MSSLSGFITYIEYLAGQTKGETTNGDLFNSPFKLGGVDVNYTSDKVVEAATAGTAAQALAWTPIAKGGFVNGDKNYDVKLVKSGADDIYAYYKDADKKFYANFDGTTYSSQINVAADTKVAYLYDNIVIPQNNLPTLKAEMKSIALVAKARRIAVKKYAA